jgi:protein-S-isoprenylcysteine O-methyltransferase Ste14
MPRVFRGAWFYLPLSAVGFRLLTWLWRPLPVELSARQRAVALLLGSLLYFPGLLLMLWGRLTLGQMYDVSSGFGARLFADHRLVTSGPYALVRHPMYVGGQLAEVCSFMLWRNWATLLIMLNAPALFLRARREEEALAAEFGAEWDTYCRHVPAWPFTQTVITPATPRIARISPATPSRPRYFISSRTYRNAEKKLKNVNQNSIAG